MSLYNGSHLHAPRTTGRPSVGHASDTRRGAPALALAVLALGALASSGCARSGIINVSPDGGAPTCVIDGDCGSGLGCVNGVCEPIQDLCTDDGDCLPTQSCDDGVCVGNPSCMEDADCPPTMTCVAGTCTAIGACDDDGDCPPGTHCDDGSCARNDSCDDDADCPATQECVAGLCTDRPACEEHGDCPATDLCVDGVCQPIGDCEGDADCPSNAHCVDGQCVQNDECLDDGNCPPSQECVDGLCTDRPACSGNEDCLDTELCVGGVCQPIGDCEDDADCPPGTHCEDLTCRQNPSCTDDADCPASQECVDGVCVDRAACTEHADCPAEDLCVDGLCQPAGSCSDDADCPAGTHCEDGTCVQNGPCEDDTDCPAAQSCVDGLCTDNMPCQDTAQCPDTETCIDGVCQNNPSCTEDLDCPVTERCEDGVCTRIGDDCTDHVDCGPGNACDNGHCIRAPCETAADCQDGLFCNGAETCDPLAGCLGAAAPTEDDGVACTVLECDEVNDVLVHVPTDSLCQDGNPCTDNTCTPTGCTFPNNDALVPPQGPSTDCVREVCSAGAVVTVADNNEAPVQASATDCVTNICLNGAVGTTPNNSEVPPQGPTTDCVREICSGGVVATTADNTETPIQSPTDCVTLVCQGGAPVGQANNAETPPSDGSECNQASCSGGAAVYTPDDGLCADSYACTLETCELDGSCASTPSDAACSCPGVGAVGVCTPGAPGANADGCVCFTPATLTCSAVPTAAQVLQPFALTATATGAAPGSTFVWDIVGTPVGADPAAQLLVGATTANATFTATSPSADASDVYTLQVTLFEPGLPPQTCAASVQALPLPDDFEITLFMADGLDVDLHVIGADHRDQNGVADGNGYLIYDMPFHPLHDPLLGDNPNRDCYWANCPVCAVDIPGQPACVEVNPRIVDFDRPTLDGASLADPNDPQLDIDNRRGCFTDAAGTLVCVPEKVTVLDPRPGLYVVWPYLYGDALSVTAGELTTPSTTVVEIEVRCRGVAQRYTRVLSSESSTTPGTPAAAASYERIGGSNGYVAFDIPSDPNQPCSLP